MPDIRAAATKTIPAPAAAVYNLIADYRDGHPHILPEKYFSDLVVEEGGRGEGTVIRFRMKLLGETRTTRAVVAEPVPGRVLTETYPENGAVTTFEIEPVGDSGHSRVTITTAWSSPGARGLFERWLVPPLLRRVFLEEMTKLDDFVRGRMPAWAAAAG